MRIKLISKFEELNKKQRFITAFGAGESCVRSTLGCIDVSGSHWRVHPRM